MSLKSIKEMQDLDRKAAIVERLRWNRIYEMREKTKSNVECQFEKTIEMLKKYGISSELNENKSNIFARSLKIGKFIPVWDGDVGMCGVEAGAGPSGKNFRRFDHNSDHERESCAIFVINGNKVSYIVIDGDTPHNKLSDTTYNLLEYGSEIREFAVYKNEKSDGLNGLLLLLVIAFVVVTAFVLS